MAKVAFSWSVEAYGPYDSLGRRGYIVRCEDPEVEYRRELAPDGQPVGHRRGQVFFVNRERIIEMERAFRRRAAQLEKERTDGS